MAWYPIGPDFVFKPRNTNFKRLSKRNENDSQGMINVIAIPPDNQNIIYAGVNPNNGGTSAFKTADGGKSWNCISDALRLSGGLIPFYAIAIDPVNPNIIYAGGGNSIIISLDQGVSWLISYLVPGNVTKLIIDPVDAGTPTSTVLYAQTNTGVFRSANGGETWDTTPVLSGEISSLIAVPAPGLPTKLYAGVVRVGVFYSDNPTSPANWINLNNNSSIGLPEYTPTTPSLDENFNYILLDYCPLNPDCIYAWFIANALDGSGNNRTAFLFTTLSPTTLWTSISFINTPPGPEQGRYCMVFTVAPNSPGNGVNDILFFGNTTLHRSIDSGGYWENMPVVLFTHNDIQAFAFFPASPLAGTVPSMYIGGDGGIIRNDKIADRSFDLVTATAEFNEGEMYLPNASGMQNLNHAMQSSACNQYAGEPATPALGAIGCQDTGINVSSGTLGWRGMINGDISVILLAKGSDAVTIWTGGFPNVMEVWKDHGSNEFSLGTPITITGSSVFIFSNSNLVLGLDNNCICGVSPNDSSGRYYVVRINHAGEASIISSDFPSLVSCVARSPVNPDFIVAGTIDNRLYFTNAASSATSATVWTEITINKPSTLDSISKLAINNSDEIFILNNAQLTTGSGSAIIQSPLLKITAMAWVHLSCGPLAAGGSFGNLLADPVDANVFYATRYDAVFKIALVAGIWEWTNISSGLPGYTIFDLWLGNFGFAASPIIILRAAICGRGVWELNVSEMGLPPAPKLFMRDNILDQSFLPTCPDGAVNPFSPAENVYHYQSADIKIDVKQTGSGLVPPFFQTDPEGALPLSHVLFNQLIDNSQQMLTLTQAYVHVHVQNHGEIIADNVKVWSIYCSASAGVPALNTSPMLMDSFSFWDQFTSAGNIVPNLPADSPWNSIGSPETLNGIDPANPQVASWLWTAPPLPTGITHGHYCIVVFIHSASGPIVESSYNVDEMVPRNKQVAQKNLCILDALPVAPLPPDEAAMIDSGMDTTRINYIEFHNAKKEKNNFDLVFDFSRMPKQIKATLRFSEIESSIPIENSVTGVKEIVNTEVNSKKGMTNFIGTFLLSIARSILRLVNRIWKTNFSIKEESSVKSPVNFSHFNFITYGGGKTIAKNIIIQPFKKCIAAMSFQNISNLEPGETYQFDVLQMLNDKVIGGCTYKLPVAGTKKEPAKFPMQEEITETEENKNNFYAPAHLKDLIMNNWIRSKKKIYK